MLTCVIRYQIDPARPEAFETYARYWAEAIPRCGARLIGYYAPCEGSTTLAYGIYDIESLAAYETYRARLRDDPAGRAAFGHARAERFITAEDRTWLRQVAP